MSSITDQLSQLRASIQAARLSYDESTEERLVLDEVVLIASCWHERSKALVALSSPEPKRFGADAAASLVSFIDTSVMQLEMLPDVASFEQALEMCEELEQTTLQISRVLDAYEDSAETRDRIAEMMDNTGWSREYQARSVPDQDHSIWEHDPPTRRGSLDEAQLTATRARRAGSLFPVHESKPPTIQAHPSIKVLQPESIDSSVSDLRSMTYTLRSEAQTGISSTKSRQPAPLTSATTYTDMATSESTDTTYQLFQTSTLIEAALPKWRFYSLDLEESIRLLELLPCKNEHEQIACASKEVSLANAPEFEMLSFEWGSPTDTRPIAISHRGKRYSYTVRATLYTALQRLRHDNNKSRFLWVDMLCIDESDHLERSAQVTMIPRIVSTAKQVCVWVGDDYGLSEEALRFAKERIGEAASLADAIAKGEHLQYWIALKALLKRPWFSRRWVVQEVVLARQAVVLCGYESLNWDDFATIVDLIDRANERLSDLASTEQHNVDPRPEFDEVPTLPGVRLIRVAKRFFRRTDKTIIPLATLQQLMWHLQPLDTSSPPDIIYSLLALAADTSPVSKDAPVIIGGKRVTPAQQRLLRRLSKIIAQFAREDYELDYDQSMCAVFQRYIAFAIKHSPPKSALDVLCRPLVPDHLPTFAAREGRERCRLPSWMPRMSQAPFIKQVNRVDHPEIPSDLSFEAYDEYTYERERGDPFVSAPGIASYYAAAEAKSSKTYFLSRPEHVSLFADGFVLDEIEHAAETSQSGHIPQSWITLGQAGITAFVRTLIADRGPGGREPPAHYEREIRALIDKVPAHGSISTIRETKKKKSAGLKDVMKHVTATISGRRLIMTKHLRCLGLAPEGVRPGDLICILYGCSVPIVLRRGAEKLVDVETVSDVQHAIPEGSLLRQRVTKWAQRARDRRAIMPADSRLTAPPAMLVAEPSVLDSSPTEEVYTSDRSDVLETAIDRSLAPPRHWILRLLTLGLVSFVLDFVLKDRTMAIFIWMICLPHILWGYPRCRALLRSMVRRSSDHGLSQADQLLIAGIAECVSPYTPDIGGVFAAIGTSVILICLYPGLLPDLGLAALQLTDTQTVLEPVADTPLSQPLSTDHGSVSKRSDKLWSQRGTLGRRGYSTISYRKLSLVRYDKDIYETQKFAFTMIGESYIDGMMYGEAIGVQNRSTGSRQEMVRPVTFEIR